MKNPFYVTLKAQKEERDKFIDFYQTGTTLLGMPEITPPEESEIQTNYMVESDKGEDEVVQPM